MADDFRISDLGKPVYEHSQVITLQELVATYNVILEVYQHLRWWQWIQKGKFQAILGAVHEMILWLQSGKPDQLH